MQIQLSFEEGLFPPESYKKPHVFLIYDTVNKKLLSLRVSKTKAGRLDRMRSTITAIKKKLPGIKEGDTLFINGKEYIFSYNVETFSKKYSYLVSNTKNTDVVLTFISFFLQNTLSNDVAINSSVMLKLFNDSLIKNSSFEIKDGQLSFLTIDFGKEKEKIYEKFETVFYKRKKITYLEEIDWLQQQQKRFLTDFNDELDLTNVENLMSSFIIKSKKFQRLRENNEFNIKYNSFFIPNSFEIDIIFQNAGISVTRKPDYFSALFKFTFFCLYYLGLDINDVFLIKKSELLTILDTELITFNLKNKSIRRTILPDTKQRFILLKTDLDTIFQNSDQIVNTNNKKHFSTKNLLLIVNKDLKIISEIFFYTTFKAESLKNSAPIRLLNYYQNFWVSEEFEITPSFTKRLETLYQTKVFKKD